ncbi:ATP-binding protein [Priestia iocasae]|uniref:histidine kinase n=1 Tax=Priestia iocasae TaxID=2291674 RepID=A0ABS2QZT7_9BACI|nr:ATP-binding protein [Metabacillus iocasae]MBM7704753.1 two-component system, sporulation sensor kinase D [Metabacillus iocasae]
MFSSFFTNSKWHNIQLYLLIVIIPSIIISLLFVQIRYYQLKEDITDHAETTALFHKNQLDRFIGETTTSIETIALMANPQKSSYTEIERILSSTHQKDLRLSGLYYVDVKGNMLFGSHRLPKQVNVFDRQYFQRVLTTKTTVISNAYFGRLTGRYIVTIATPILDENKNIKAILLASLRLNYIESLMAELTPDTKVDVYDRNQLLVFQANDSAHTADIFVRTQLESVPWTVAVSATSIPRKDIFGLFLIALLSSFVVTNILFLIVKLLLVKRQAAKEHAQNESQKLELIGTLAASTAHEIRNPLTGIKGLVSLLSEKYTKEEDQFYFSIIQTEIDRINQIASEFLVLGKPTAENRKDYDLQSIVHEVIPIVESEANLHQITLLTNIDKEKLPIHCDKNQIKQVLLNLTKNALGSMESGGILTIVLTKKDHTCMMKVIDTGIGIPPERLAKIFHPFFTMKSEGTGLGLVVCKRIIEMYDGTIHIKSEVDVGTEVEVCLPLSHSHLY